METGTVVTLKLEKGFGFIRSNGRDIFFHMRDLADGLVFCELLKERRVKFDVVDTAKGPRAANVQAVE